MTPHTFQRTYPNGTSTPKNGLWFALNKQGVLIARINDKRFLPMGEAPLPNMQPENVLHLGNLDGTPCLACALPDDVGLPDGYRQFTLRDLYGHIDEAHYAIAGYASQLLLWQQQANFCMVCGTSLQPISGEWGKRCPNCGFTMYPPVSPCTITLIHDGDRILMTHKDGWGPRYGLVAGFVEPGETLEENVTREILEETGVQVTDIQYWRSQPWPFPHQLMCGFYARYVSGQIKIDADELDDARWYSQSDIRNGTPVIPPPLSIARQLIDHWMNEAR